MSYQLNYLNQNEELEQEGTANLILKQFVSQSVGPSLYFVLKPFPNGLVIKDSAIIHNHCELENIIKSFFISKLKFSNFGITLSKQDIRQSVKKD